MCLCLRRSVVLDRTIPFFNTIMKCSDYLNRETRLPEGFSIVPYQPGFEKEWARLEYSIGDFDSPEEAEKYFAETYLKDPKLKTDILFATDRNNEVAGSCIAWRDMRGEETVSSLHWLVVDEPYQRIGLGRALCIAVMNIYADKNAFPVYIHTQPWSWKAVLLYHSLGFRMQKSDSFSHYINEYEKAMNELRKIVPEDRYELLKQTAEE